MEKKHKKDILRIASELILEWDICPLYGISLYWGLIPRLNSQFLCVKGQPLPGIKGDRDSDRPRGKYRRIRVKMTKKEN